ARAESQALCHRLVGGEVSRARGEGKTAKVLAVGRRHLIVLAPGCGGVKLRVRTMLLRCDGGGAGVHQSALDGVAAVIGDDVEASGIAERCALLLAVGELGRLERARRFEEGTIPGAVAAAGAAATGSRLGAMGR